MDILKDKSYLQFDYKSRYANVPFYYNPVKDRDECGIRSSMITEGVDYVVYKVQVGDTLDKLALKYYNNPTYWWVIYDFNHMIDAFADLKENYDTLKLPSISALTFGDLR